MAKHIGSLRSQFNLTVTSNHNRNPEISITGTNQSEIDDYINQILNTQKIISIYRAHSLRSQAISRMKEIRVQ